MKSIEAQASRGSNPLPSAIFPKSFKDFTASTLVHATDHKLPETISHYFSVGEPETQVSFFLQVMSADGLSRCYDRAWFLFDKFIARLMDYADPARKQRIWREVHEMPPVQRQSVQ